MVEDENFPIDLPTRKKVESIDNPEDTLYRLHSAMQNDGLSSILYDLPGSVRRLAERLIPRGWISSYWVTEEYRVKNNLAKHAFWPPCDHTD